MVDHGKLHEALREFVAGLTGRYDIGRVLYALTDHAVTVLGCDGAGVAIREGGRLQFVSATDEQVTRIEETQIAGDEGPCYDAYHTGGQVQSFDLRAEDRWPAYRSEALAQGARAVAGLPLVAHGSPIGALNLYWAAPHECGDDELAAGQLLADMAAAYITNLSKLDAAERLSGQLEQALDSRVVIEQAKGMLARDHDIDPEAAFEVLRDHARPRQLRVHDVAEQVVAGDLELRP